MSFELIKEPIKVSRVVGEEFIQAVIENDIIVPDIKPDIGRILLLDGDAGVVGTDVLHEKVLVNGQINYRILYVSDSEEKQIKSINTGTNFSQSFEVAGATPGMSCRAKCDVEHIEYSVLNGRKIGVKAIVKVNTRIMGEVEKNIISSITETDDVQIRTGSAKINYYVGSSETDCLVRENLEVPAGKPAIGEILRSDIKITGKDYKVTDNKVIAKGELNVFTLYLGDDGDRSIQFMEHEVPFTQFIELSGVDDNTACDVDFQVFESRFEPLEDSDGELRLLDGEVGLRINVAGFNRGSIDVVADAYSPHAGLSLEKEDFVSQEVVDESTNQVILKDTMALPDDCPEITEVFNVLCKPSLSEVTILEGKVVIEGVVNNNVLYLANSEDQPVHCYTQELPFKQNIEVKDVNPGMACAVGLDVEHCNYSMLSGNEVEVRLVIALSLRVTKDSVLPLVTKVVETPLDDKKLAAMPSMVIYFAKHGDTLWDVAKKYYVKLDDLKRLNDLDEELLTPGQQILIPKKVS